MASDAREGLPSQGPRFAMVAGESSGDLLAGLLLDGLHRRWPDLRAEGIGGARMLERGFQAWWPSEKLAVRGYVEVLRHYREIVGIRNQLRERLLAAPPDVFVGVDAPDFNLALEQDLRRRGVKTVHFICPSVWAWRPERVRQIRASADHVLCVFPFEPELLQSHGIASTYVGHPLASVIPMEPDRLEARRMLGLSPEAEVVAILPGSRGSEIQYLGERFFAAARRLQQMRPGLRCVVPAVPTQRARIEALARTADMAGRVQVVAGNSHAVLAACDAALVASGTATLETALFKRPMVIAYNMHWLSWRIMRGKRLQPWVGLPNILCRDMVVPELLQEQATPDALVEAVLPWLDDPAARSRVEQRFVSLHHDLRRDTFQLASDAISQVLAS